MNSLFSTLNKKLRKDHIKISNVTFNGQIEENLFKICHEHAFFHDRFIASIELRGSTIRIACSSLYSYLEYDMNDPLWNPNDILYIIKALDKLPNR